MEASNHLVEKEGYRIWVGLVRGLHNADRYGKSGVQHFSSLRNGPTTVHFSYNLQYNISKYISKYDPDPNRYDNQLPRTLPRTVTN